MKASMDRVRSSLPEAKQKEFDEAVQLLAFQSVDMGSLLAEGSRAGASGGPSEDQIGA